MIICNLCKYGDRGMDEHPCDKCVHNTTDQFEPMSNFERIKKMSVEEFVEWVLFDAIEIARQYTQSTTGLQDWLEQSVTID